jgi:GT2 family glycosyltransferase
MSKNLIGIVTFGNFQFTRLAIESIMETTKIPVDFFCVIGKPDDEVTANYLKEANIPFVRHINNYGFPKSVNDIYDYAWKENDYDNLILAGNDIVAYPYAVDSLITLANLSNYDAISAIQYDVRSLVAEHPETRQYFSGDNFVVNDFSSKFWNKFTGYSPKLDIANMQLYDIQNLCLYKKSVFNAVGYTDVAFFPAYFIDNDYAQRMVRTGLRFCSLGNARFFHFWSRTIHQGGGGSNSHYFQNNREYYISKWGGEPGRETKVPNLYIGSRESEGNIIEYWRNR